MNANTRSEAMDTPERHDLPLFVYGALKPGLPGFETLRRWVFSSEPDSVAGELLVRDGLPLLHLNDHGMVEGYLLQWTQGQAQYAYADVCAFEPSKHYQWAEVALRSGEKAKALVIRYPSKGNPQHLYSSSWNISDDPACDAGLDAIHSSLRELLAITLKPELVFQCRMSRRAATGR